MNEFFEFSRNFNKYLKNNSFPTIELVAGDASDRKFYRLKLDNTSSYICMEFETWDESFGGNPECWLNIHTALNAVDIALPEIFLVDKERKRIWISDLGNDFLNYQIKDQVLDIDNLAQQETINLYRQAIEILVNIQYPTKKMPSHRAENRFFDHEKLSSEIEFFMSHFLKGLLPLKIPHFKPDFDAHKVLIELKEICRWLSLRPFVFCHRDYHVRNIMVFNKKPFLIDFQDARMGPHTYDLVSLLRDSYTEMTLNTRIKFLEDYEQKLSARIGNEVTQGLNLPLEAQYMGLQRNLKAIGSFGYLYTKKGKTSYESYVYPTLKTVHQYSDFLKNVCPNTLLMIEQLLAKWR